MAIKIDETRLYANDELVAYDDGSFRYFDTTGDYEDIMDVAALEIWLQEDGYDDSDNKIENWIANL